MPALDTDTVTLFLAFLALLAQVAVVVALVLAVGGRFVPALARARSRIAAELAPQALALAAVVALVSTTGSLYLSEVANFPPCRLCWFQRVAMYPLVVVLGVAAVRRDREPRIDAAVLAGLGSLVSIWHVAVERYPTLEGSSCDPLNPCSIKWVERFGYLTIPGMALSGFALILVLLAAARPVSSEEHP